METIKCKGKATTGENNGLNRKIMDKEISDALKERTEKKYEKDLTVSVELIGENKINVAELMKRVRDLCGGLMACRYTGLNKYELTMNHPKGKERLLEGFKIGQTRVLAHEVHNDELVVSFLNLPAYISDEEIIGKLHGWGVSVTSAIRRRMWPGTNIADGTRFVRVRFNEQVQSLPYSTKFNTVMGPEYFRVIHDRQVKVCRLCIQPGHILRECPEFMCHKCGIQGHYARECGQREEKCKLCRNAMSKCMCNESEEQRTSESEVESMGEEQSGESGEGELVSACVVACTGEAEEPLPSAQIPGAHCENRGGAEMSSNLDGVSVKTPTVELVKGAGGAGFVKRPDFSTLLKTDELTGQSAVPETRDENGMTPSLLQNSTESDLEMDCIDIQNLRKRQAQHWHVKKSKRNKGRRSSK